MPSGWACQLLELIDVTGGALALLTRDSVTVSAFYHTGCFNRNWGLIEGGGLIEQGVGFIEVGERSPQVSQ